MVLYNVLYMAAVVYSYGEAAGVPILARVRDMLKCEHQQLFLLSIPENVINDLALCRKEVNSFEVSSLCND